MSPMDFRGQYSYLNLSEEQSMQHLHFTKEVLTEICHLLQADLQPQSRTRSAWPMAVKVTMDLNFFASGSFQAGADDICNITLFVIHFCTREKSEALYGKRGEYISFSLAREKQVEQTHGFTMIAGFSMVQSAIVHIGRDSSPSMSSWCNHTQSIKQVNAWFPGSSHNALILQQSAVPSAFEPLQQQTRGWLLGDEGYPLTTWLMTKLCNPTTCGQHSFNESHAITRNLINQTIGMFKQCFRCLDRFG
uniref:putative nuclease HARBI1 n=1 Tax=Pristiophorus japonicus TaxID=55135 RepID=UPI00398F1F10